MKANYLIFTGLFLRYVYYLLSDTYTIEYLKTKLWKSLVLSFLFASVLCYISFFGHFIENADSDYFIVFIMVGFVFVGWACDSVFLSVMKLYEQKFKAKIEG